MNANVDSLEIQIEASATKANAELDKLISKLKIVQSVLGTSSKNIAGIQNSTEKAIKVSNRGTKSMIGGFVKLGVVIMMLRRAFGYLSNAIKNSMDYGETINLFQTAFRDIGKKSGEEFEFAFLEKAEDFQNSLTTSLSIDPDLFMNYQAVFASVASSMGLTASAAYDLSESFTLLGADIASLYNLGFEESMLKLQSALSGQSMAIRSLGVDITNTTMAEKALSLGITKNVKDMTQAEKAQLRYIMIMETLTVAQGDMARTLNSPSNQLRILKEQFNQLSRAIGNVFIPIITTVLPYINALAMGLKNLFTTIAKLVGFTLPDFKETPVEIFASDDVESEIDGVTGAIKKLKNATAGFDELNVISQDAGGGAGGGGSSFDLSEKIAAMNAEYKAVVDKITQEVQSKAEEILKKFQPVLTWIENHLDKIWYFVIGIGAGLLTWRIASAFTKGVSNVLLNLKGISSALLIVFGTATLVAGAIDAWVNGTSWGNLLAMLGGMGAMVGGLAISFGTVGAAIGLIVGGITLLVTGIKDALSGSKTLQTTLAVIGGIMSVAGGIAIIIGGWIPLVVGAVAAAIAAVVIYWDEIKDFFVKMWKGVVNVFEKCADWINNSVVQPIAGFFSGLWKTVTGFLSDTWNSITGFFSRFWNGFVQAAKSVWEVVRVPIALILTLFDWVWQGVKAIYSAVAGWFTSNVITPVSTAFNNLVNNIKTFFSNAWTAIKDIWTAVSSWFDKNVVQPLKTLFDKLTSGIKEFFSNAWNGIKSVWNAVSSWFDNSVVTPVKNAFDNATKAIGGFFTRLWNDIKNTFKSVKEWFQTNVADPITNVFKGAINLVIDAANWLIRGLNKISIKIPDWVSDLLGMEQGATFGFSIPTIPRFAEGGFPNTGELFLARENGIPEMVGRFGGRTAVANNDQITSGIREAVVQGMLIGLTV